MTSRVSTSLCRVVFESSKANDALSFMTILSADLKVLKQWGYNGVSVTILYRLQVADSSVHHQLVDKIIRQQKAEREAAENARVETEASLILRPPQTTMGDTQTRIRPMQTRVPLPPTGTATTAAPQRNAEQEATNKTGAETRASLASNPPERTSRDTRTRTPTMQTFILIPPTGTTRAAPPQQNTEREASRAEPRASPVSDPPQMTMRETYTRVPPRQPNISSRQTNTAMAALRRQTAGREAAGESRAETTASSTSSSPEMMAQNARTAIPTTQPTIPPPPTDPRIAAPRPPATPRSTDRKRKTTRSRLSSAIRKLGRLLRGRSRSDASSSGPIFPRESEDNVSPSDPVPHRRDVPPLPNASLPESAPWLASPGLSRTTIRRPPPSVPTTTSQSNLGTSLETVSGFHLMFRCT